MSDAPDKAVAALQAQLRQAQKMAAVGQLASGIAHDFNNLLTVILSTAVLLRENPALAARDRELVTAMDQAAGRAADLTRQLLGFARQSVLRSEPVHLGRVVDEVVSLLGRTIDPGVRLESTAAADLWPVLADASQMSQVVMNLCLNARDAMPGGGRIVLQCDNLTLDEAEAARHAGGRPGDFVRLRVRDTGHGIPPDVLPRILEPFFTTKGPGRGTGLGLATVAGIVEQHHGWIECTSEVGRGTCFDIFLPRTDRPVSSAPAPAPAAVAGGRETILLVDDEAVIRNVGRGILQRHGYTVLLAGDGPEGLAVYKREKGRIDLVILDLTMPELSGEDTFRRLLVIDANARVLLSSGYGAEQVGEVLGDGVMGFISKPYRPHELAAAVRAALDRAVKGGPSA
jgi:nitrogen-specific signal transduction histidine kinase/ActR/RegA family two-component response regulator